MRIIHIGHAPLRAGHPDFDRIPCHPGSWVVNLCKAQTKAGMHAEIVMHVPGTSQYYQDNSLGFPIHYIPGPYRLRAATFFYFDKLRISKFVKTLDADIVHAHGTEEAYLLAAQMTAKPYVITAQGMYSQINSVVPPKLVSRARIVEFLERRALSRAGHIVAKSDYVAQWISRTYPHLVIHRIPNTFDPGLLSIDDTGPKEPGSIAFVGSVDPRKGLHLVAAALEHLAQGGSQFSIPEQLTLHIFGNRIENPTAYEKSTIGNLKSLLGERLHLHGVVSPSDLPQKLACCELLVAPSLEEMFGNQVIEAMLVNTHPLVSSETAMAENVSRIGVGTIFKNGDAADLAGKISETVQRQIVTLKSSSDSKTQSPRTGDPARISKFRAQRERLLEYMGPETVARQHWDLYETVLGDWKN